ncbi:uncharacterized protein SCODWIG_03190 [Saccharomycodes ludwigii]|uniref:BZIP domain-containing protein n=1 Tax=Saccharomycodes ludwigii TaxID=36035 RepID=A0A376BA29_9ASCO|nr:hypothetical protein SCDLUD_000612 [Saccharomycodes ludwigii]KAH3903008.1 hypothetical protein SCDLUD_000612 [Saccharomycodes ludwigii]SSD61429.1 uncharacterized protein SCODWIG_03190 [Saccharomycodes ludwigii]
MSTIITSENTTTKTFTPNTNVAAVIPADFKSTLPPRKRAKTKEEKEQRRIERILRNRKAAHKSRERKRQQLTYLSEKCNILEKILATVDLSLLNDEALGLYQNYMENLLPKEKDLFLGGGCYTATTSGYGIHSTISTPISNISESFDDANTVKSENQKEAIIGNEEDVYNLTPESELLQPVDSIGDVSGIEFKPNVVEFATLISKQSGQKQEGIKEEEMDEGRQLEILFCNNNYNVNEDKRYPAELIARVSYILYY